MPKVHIYSVDTVEEIFTLNIVLQYQMKTK